MKHKVYAFLLGFATCIAVVNIVRKVQGYDAWTKYLSEGWESWPIWQSCVSLFFVVIFMIPILVGTDRGGKDVI